MSLVELAAQTAATTRSSLIAAMWRGAPSIELLKIALSGGISPEAADKMALQVERLKAHSANADRLGDLTKKADKLQKTFEIRRTELQSQIDRIETEIADSAELVHIAQREAMAAQNDRDEILGAAAHGLVPPDNQHVLANAEAERKEGERRQVHHRWLAAPGLLEKNIRIHRTWVERLNNLISERMETVFTDGETYDRESCRAMVDEGIAAIKASRKELIAAQAAARAAGYEAEIPSHLLADDAETGKAGGRSNR